MPKSNILGQDMLTMLAVLLGGLSVGNAQSLPDLPMLPSWPGISSSCYNALNTTVDNCPGFLGRVTLNNARLNSTQVSSLCTTSCLTSLKNVRTTILQGCNNATTDVITYFDGNTYPATYVIDYWLYFYSLGCRRNKNTGNWCDPQMISWFAQGTPLTAIQNCSDCMIGNYQTQLNSPFDYSYQLELYYQRLTSSCSATTYSYTTPGKYVVSTNSASTTITATVSPTAGNPACSATYTVQSGDTCNSISKSQNVSTYAVVNAGNTDVGCTSLVAGQVLCLGGQQCSVYTLQEGDSCSSIISAQGGGITGAQLLAWNPNINSLCGNLYPLTGSNICVSPPGGALGVVTVSTPLAVSTPATAAPKPTNAPAQSNSNCGTWYTVQEGDYCDKLSVQFGISLKDFYFLNPEINNPNCTNLLLGISYCVQAVGNIATYSGYPTTSAFYSLTSATYTTKPAYIPTLGPVPMTTTVQLPTASGTANNCTIYRNYIQVPGVVDQSQNIDASPLVPYINDCNLLTGTYGVQISDLLKWNPTLNSSNCALQPGFSYCVSMGSDVPNIQGEDDCLSVDPSSIHNNTIATCVCYTPVYGFDSGSYGCDDLADEYSITVADIQNWNPWVGSNCDTGIFSGTNSTNYNAVCIGTNSTAPTSTAGTGPATTTTGTMAPTQTGIIAGCTQFYTVKSGDSCASIEALFAITFAQFYAWNPAIGSNCQSLYVGYAYCVAGPASATTTTAAAAPTQSGTASGCTTYYTVQSGDSCSSIQTQFGITFATLYKWNPGIGSDCESLWVGYGECVAGGPN